MTQAQQTLPTTSENARTAELGLIEVLIVLAKHKKKIFLLPVVAAVVAVAISFALPNVYRSTVKLLPPQQSQSGAAALLSQLGGLGGAVAGGAGLKTPNDLYVGMLRSRTIGDRLVAKYNLKKVYDTDSLEKARKELGENTNIVSGKDGFITIDVDDEDQKRVAQLANSYVDELANLNKVLAVTEAAKRRLFFQQQLEVAKDNLAKAEMTLKSTLDTRGVISVDTESRAIVETMARLRAQVSAKEIELSSKEAFVTTSNPEYRRTQQELVSLRAELSKLANGRPEMAENSSGKEAGLENIRVLRELKYNQMLYELLAKQYEAARLDEAKDPSIVQVLDTAVEPEKKFKPRRVLIALLTAAGALLLVIAWVFVVEMKERVLRSADEAESWRRFVSYLRS
jgi:tyrosine-protein kinase Etk/Wzc